jgi:type I restriction enzyme M protein
MNNFPLETDVRIQVNKRLRNLGWEFDGINRNVFLEQPKTESEKKKLGGKRPDYVLYEKGKDTPLIVIETKKRGANINSAVEQGKFYAETLNAPIVFATDGVYYKSLHTITQKPLLLNGEEVDELIRELTAIQYLEQGSNELDTIPKKIQLSRQELIGIFNEANNALRVEGLRAGIERFSEFSNILFLKLFSEIDNLKEQQDFDRKHKWDFYKGKPADEILDYINNIVFPKISTHYNDINILNPLQIKDGKVLKKIIDKLDPLVLTDINSDIKGDAFEYFLKSTTATGNDLGEYFTPRHIVKMMVKLANPQIGEKIYDPFCGTGGMLIESFRHIYNTMPRNERTLKQLKENTVFGHEITNTARITKMNMILAGDGHSNIQMKNSLADPDSISDKFDVVLTNMPYSQTTEHGSLYDIPTKNGDSICVQHCIKAIDGTAENGRIVMVVPEGFLFRKDLQRTREYMLSQCKLQSVISLPQGVFLPYTGVKTNVVYLTKVKREATKNHYWYFDVKNDGYSLDNNRRKLEGENDIERFLANRKIDEHNKSENLNVGFEIITTEALKKNDYILSGYRYRLLEMSYGTKWETTKIKEFASVLSGYAFSSDFFNDKIGIPVIRIRDINSGQTPIKYNGTYRQEYIINNGDILVSMDGEFNSVIWEGGTALLNQRVCKIQPHHSSCLPKFLFYLIRRQLKIIEDNTPFTTVKHISIKQIGDIEIPLPPLTFQKSIIEELSSYETIISVNRLSADTYKSRLPENDDWEFVELKEVCKYSGGTQPPKSTFIYESRDGYIRLLQIRDYKSDDNAVYIPVSEKYKTCTEKDIMIGRYGPPVFQILRGKKGAYNVALIKCIPDKKRLTEDWLYYFLNSEQIQNHIIGLSERSRQSGVSPSDLDKLKIPLPSIEVQKEIVAKIKEEERLIAANKKLVEIFEEKITNRVNQIWGI